MTLTARANAQDDDSDLQDLLREEEEEGVAGRSSTATSTSARRTTNDQQNKTLPNNSFRNDKKPVKYSDYYNNFNKASSSSDCSVLLRIPELICFYFTYFLLHNPLLGKVAVLSLLVFLIYTLLNLSTSSSQSIGIIKYDFSTIQSRYDFDIGKVDHWCIKGGNDCACPDPLTPVSRSHKAWVQAVERHKNMIDQVPNPDVVFLGQSLVEVFNGRINGSDRSSDEYFGKVKNYFESHFGGTGQGVDSDAKAIAMGLTGDSTSNVLWRLLHGELPDDFDPPIWWLVLGMEDVGRYGCSEEITVMGVLRIIEEIKMRRPNAKIVVNSLLPMIKMRMSAADNDKEFMDAERDHGKGPHPRRQHKKEEQEDDGKVVQSKNKNRKNENKPVRMLKESQGGGGGNGGGGFNGHVSESNATVYHKNAAKNKQEKLKQKLVKKYEKEVQKDKFNPQLKDVKTFKKKGHHFENKIPMWSAVHEINKELHKFCKRTPHVTFFDATSIFTTEGSGGNYILLTDMISPRGHPTVKGFKAWMDVMVKQVGEWKKKMDHAAEMHNGDPDSWTMGNWSYYNNLDDTTNFYPEDEHDDGGDE